MKKISDYLDKIPDFPEKGITFFDISPLLNDGELWGSCIERLRNLIVDYEPSRLVGIESRGFLLAAPIAYAMGIGFTMIRKKGKLPGKTIEFCYNLEYGSNTLEIQSGKVSPQDRVIIVDDVMATGGTMAASYSLLKQEGVEPLIGLCLLELLWLGGREKLKFPLVSLDSIDVGDF